MKTERRDRVKHVAGTGLEMASMILDVVPPGELGVPVLLVTSPILATGLLVAAGSGVVLAATKRVVMCDLKHCIDRQGNHRDGRCECSKECGCWEIPGLVRGWSAGGG